MTSIIANGLLTLLAGFTGWKGKDQAIGAVKTTLDLVAGPFLNVASAILGVVFVWKVVEHTRAHLAGEGSQDEIMKLGILLVGTILLMQVIRVLFFD